MNTPTIGYKRPVTLLGTRLHAFTIEEWNRTIANGIRTGEKTIVFSVNLHALYLLGRDQAYQSAHTAATFKRIDGMAIVGLGRLLGNPLRRSHRLTWLDWIDPLFTMAEESGWSVFYLGSEPTVVALGEKLLRESYPRLRFASHHGYFDADRHSDENLRVLNKMRTFGPDILIVGMGMPRQEIWVSDNRDSISAPVILTAGACMDYIAGVERTPPRWLGALGMEWAYRLAGNPRRLGRRYLIEPWYLLGRIFREILRRWVVS